MHKPLIIVPCTSAKIWRIGKVRPDEQVPACGAYMGQVWAQHLKYAKMYGSSWMILSARYGFITPQTPIQDYNESFIKGTATVSDTLLREQAILLASHQHIVSLGSKAYNEAIRKAFIDLDVNIEYPLDGLQQLLARQWVIQRLPVPEGGRYVETYQESQARHKRQTDNRLAKQKEQLRFDE